MLFFLLYLFVFESFYFVSSSSSTNDQCTKDTCGTLTPSTYFFLYDVNPGEGFNLRRDVYVRMANLVYLLRQRTTPSSNWILVLPPWGPLYHWFSHDLPRTQLPWSLFFDLTSLERFVPVIEFDDFIRQSSTIPFVFTLQHFREGWGENFEEKSEIRPCIDEPLYKKHSDQFYYGWFFGYEDRVRAEQFNCLSAQGFVTVLIDFITKNFTWPVDTSVKSVMFDRAETLLHVDYGGQNYWRARRSMRYAKHLIQLGKKTQRKTSVEFVRKFFVFRKSFSC